MQLNGYIEPQELDKTFEAFWKYITSHYQILSIYKELPLIEVAHHNGTITSGLADLVFETNKGLVLIDHKTFPGHFEDMTLNPNHDQYAGSNIRINIQNYPACLLASFFNPLAYRIRIL